MEIIGTLLIHTQSIPLAPSTLAGERCVAGHAEPEKLPDKTLQGMKHHP